MTLAQLHILAEADGRLDPIRVLIRVLGGKKPDAPIIQKRAVLVDGQEVEVSPAVRRDMTPEEFRAVAEAYGAQPGTSYDLMRLQQMRVQGSG